MKHTHVKKALVSKDNPCIVNGILPSGVVVQIADCKSFLPREYEQEANAKRFVVLWNAAEGMSNEEAVKYLKYGREMGRVLEDINEAAVEAQGEWASVAQPYMPIDLVSYDDIAILADSMLKKLEG